MSQVSTTTPFAWPAIWYVLVGVGFALMVPASSAAAMAEVPAGSSGIGSGLFNAGRQVGTAMGLAILGSIATVVILADWHNEARSFTSAAQVHAQHLGTAVAGGQAHLAVAALGRPAFDPAVSAFARGFEVALLIAAAILVVAAAIGYFGLRHLPPAGERVQLAGAHASGPLTHGWTCGAVSSRVGRG